MLVHGEPERQDMVRYFVDQLTGLVLAVQGWVQSYGSRCVHARALRDVFSPAPMTLEWTRNPQSHTSKPVKCMLTGPVSMLRRSLVGDDQPEADTTVQQTLSIRDELISLQSSAVG